MDETVIVIMLKDNETGFLEKEVCCIKVVEYENLIVNTFAENKDQVYYIHMKFSTVSDVEDWEYDAIYDYYDDEKLLSEAISVSEVADTYNPTWEVVFVHESDRLTEEKIQKILFLHKQELDDVLEVIKNKENEYK